MSYQQKRVITYCVITIFTIVLPFVTINGNHMLLLSFDKMQFHFAGFAFAMQELYLMPFLLMILFIGIFVITTIGGRIWCGWACPQTIFRVLFRDFIESKLFGLRKINNKQQQIDYSKYSNQLKKIGATLVFLLFALFISTNFMWYFVPPEDFLAYLQDPQEHIFMILFILGTTVFLFYTVVLTKEDFCTYFCPYSRVQSVLYDDNTKQVVYDTTRGGNIYHNGQKIVFSAKELQKSEECTLCDLCVKVCPTHIDIKKGLQVECINCLECVDACTSVMGKLQKPSLIQWGSTNSVLLKKKTTILSPKNIMYFASILACVVLLVVFANSKEYMLVNVNRTTDLFKIDANNLVKNNYVFTVQNTQNQAYTYDIKVNHADFEMTKFTPFRLEANQRVKKVISIESNKVLHLSNEKNTPISLEVTIFAQEDPTVVTTTKTIAFIYPKDSLLK
ncbi:MAG: cytochrome c oxidase accessory protein CcoG [Arcobacteraceae bacterium]